MFNSKGKTYFLFHGPKWLSKEKILTEFTTGDMKKELNSDQNPGYVLYVWDYTTQLYGGATTVGTFVVNIVDCTYYPLTLLFH